MVYNRKNTAEVSDEQSRLSSNRSTETDTLLLSNKGIVFLEQKQGESSEEPFIVAKRELMCAHLAGFGEYEDKPITLYINTYGSSVDEATSLYDLIISLQKYENLYINTVAQGYAFSAGSVVLQAGRIRQATENSILMLHTVRTPGIDGSSFDITKGLEFISLLDDNIITILSKRSNLTKKRLIAILKDKGDWFLDAQKALKYGFIDEII